MKLATQTAPAQDDFSTALNELRLRYELSYKTLGRLIGGTANGANENLIFRLCSDKAKPEEFAKFKPLLAQGLKLYLLSLGMTASNVATELSSIFNEGELNMASIKRTTLPPAIQRKFGLRRDPFERPRANEVFHVFTNDALDNVFNRIIEAIQYQQFIAVIGDIGAGKTLMKDRVRQHVEEHEELSLLWPRCEAMEKVKVASILRFVLESFGMKCPQDAIARSTRFETMLSQLYQNGKRVAIGFDECHRLPDETLTSLKNFHEIGAKFVNFLGIILIGQPSFKATLNRPEFREIAERIDVIEMPSIEKVAAEYVEYRIQLAGGEMEKIFDRDAVTYLTQMANTPLGLGNLCNKALLLAAKYPDSRVTAAFLLSKQKELGLSLEPRLMAVRRQQ